MGKFFNRLIILNKFILASFFLLGLFFVPTAQIAATGPNDCGPGPATAVSFDVNPKSGPVNQAFTISGSVTLNNLITNQGSAFNGGCWYPGTDHIVLKIVVSIYDKNSQQTLLSDFSLNLPTSDQQGGRASVTQTLNFPSLTFKPSQSFGTANPPNNLQVAALVKVNDPLNSNNWANLTESAPVSIATTPASGGGTSGDFCSTADSSDCAEGFYCDINASKTCKPSVAGTDCSQDSTICAAPLTCVNNKCANPSVPSPNPAQPGAPGAPGASSVVIKPFICDLNNPDPTHCTYNPLPVDNLKDALLVFLKSFMELMGVTTVAFIILGGYKLAISSGNEEMRTSAKKTITWAIVGFVIAMLAFSIITIVQDLLGKTVS